MRLMLFVRALITTDSVRWRRFRHLLVAAEVAAACMLLSGAITVVRLVERPHGSRYRDRPSDRPDTFG